MEIFLLLLVIVLLLVLRKNQKSEIEVVYKKLHDLDKTIKQIQVSENIPTFSKEEIKRTPEVKTETWKVEIKPQVVVEPKKEEPPLKEAPVIEPEKKGVLANDPEVIDIHNEIFKYDEIYRPQQPIQVKEPEISWWDKFKIANPDLEKF